ncbi:hypothetical protein J3R30DRAFT_2591479 [Lentinula aciculospora]|uniref:Uncharacterized protein n=1 Tax=Lentinula aciculospora TaxID=153920 RepID=A0A9W9ADJ8_9AGAR|nr:hypothetical protein J3R30DRAFT_2591479 [Lentinula aciculospora]
MICFVPIDTIRFVIASVLVNIVPSASAFYQLHLVHRIVNRKLVRSFQGSPKPMVVTWRGIENLHRHVYTCIKLIAVDHEISVDANELASTSSGAASKFQHPYRFRSTFSFLSATTSHGSRSYTDGLARYNRFLITNCMINEFISASIRYIHTYIHTTTTRMRRINS